MIVVWVNKNGHDLTGFGCNNIIKLIHGKAWFDIWVGSFINIAYLHRGVKFSILLPIIKRFLLENQILTLTWKPLASVPVKIFIFTMLSSNSGEFVKKLRNFSNVWVGEW